MKIEQYLRTIITSKFVPLVKKDKCEVCESEEDLCVHHVKPFAEILKETLEELNLGYKDTTDYSECELGFIANIVMGKHLRYEYLTLCKDCHKKIHSDLGGTYKIGGKFELYIERLRLKKELRNENGVTSLIEYLKNNTNKHLDKDKQKQLVRIANIRDDRDRLQKSITMINKYFVKNEIPYLLESKRKSLRVNGKVNKDAFWIIYKI